MNKENKEKVKMNVCQIKDCGRPTHKESKYCIFHASAVEKTEEEFKEALEDYINRVTRESRVYNFEKFIFIGDLDFSKDFNLNKIHKCNFKGTEFYNGKVRFDTIEFSRETKFIDCKFVSKVSFIGSEFRDNLYIGNVHFFDQVNFNKTRFHSIEIKGTTFEGGMNSFNEAYFGGDLLIESCRFMHDIDFSHAEFHGNVKMGGKEFNNSIFNFEGADINYNFEIFFNSMKKIQIKFNNITTYPTFTKIIIAATNAGIYFNNANLEKTELCFELHNSTFIDFQKTRMKDTYLRYDQIKHFIVQENRKDYEQAREVYLTLKNNFHSIGRYNDESSTYKMEMDMERFAYFKNSRYLKWTISGFLNFLYGYGEEPLKVLRFAIIVILFFSFLYFNYGISLFIPEIRNVKYDFFQNVWLGIKNTKLLISIIINFPWGDYLNSLYFSLTTFATLAFGNIGPITIVSKIIAGIESFIGPFTIALFVYTFARKTGGR